MEGVGVKREILDNSKVTCTNDWPCSNNKPVKIEEGIKLNDDLLREWTNEAEDVKRVSKYHRKEEKEIKCEVEMDCDDASLESKDGHSKIHVSGAERNQIKDLCGQTNTKKKMLLQCKKSLKGFVRVLQCRRDCSIHVSLNVLFAAKVCWVGISSKDILLLVQLVSQKYYYAIWNSSFRRLSVSLANFVQQKCCAIMYF